MGVTVPAQAQRWAVSGRRLSGDAGSGRCTVVVTVRRKRVRVFPHGVAGLGIELTLAEAQVLRDALDEAIPAARAGWETTT